MLSDNIINLEGIPELWVFDHSVEYIPYTDKNFFFETQKSGPIFFNEVGDPLQWHPHKVVNRKEFERRFSLYDRPLLTQPTYLSASISVAIKNLN